MMRNHLSMFYAMAMAGFMSIILGAAEMDPPAAGQTAKFAKLCLGTKEAKLLVFAFDQADGPGTSYNTLRILPVNFAAAAKTVEARRTETKDQGIRRPGKLQFDPLPLDDFLKAADIPTDTNKPVVVAVAFSEIQEDKDGKIEYLEALLAIAKQSSEKAILMEAKGRPSFLSTWAKFTLAAQDAGGNWEYHATQPLELATTQAAATLLDPTAAPGLDVLADVVAGKLYITAVIGRSPKSKSLLEGATPQDVMISGIARNGKPEDVRVTVKDNAGKLVYQVAGAPDFFWPSVSSGLILQSKARCALPAKGKYHVEAIVNTGPLAGELTAVKDVVCK